MCDVLDVMVHVQYEEPCLDLESKPITRGMRKGGVGHVQFEEPCLDLESKPITRGRYKRGVGKYCVCVTYWM